MNNKTTTSVIIAQALRKATPEIENAESAGYDNSEQDAGLAVPTEPGKARWEPLYYEACRLREQAREMFYVIATEISEYVEEHPELPERTKKGLRQAYSDASKGGNGLARRGASQGP